MRRIAIAKNHETVYHHATAFLGSIIARNIIFFNINQKSFLTEGRKTTSGVFGAILKGEWFQLENLKIPLGGRRGGCHAVTGGVGGGSRDGVGMEYLAYIKMKKVGDSLLKER